MKLALGTVQFGASYGIANLGGRVSENEVKSILDLAKISGINMLDTAAAYGDSEGIIGRLAPKDLSIVTKISEVPAACTDVYSYINEQFLGSLNRLGVDHVFGLMLHRPSQLMSDLGSDIYRALVDIRLSGKAKKIGVSIYAPSELDDLFGYYDFDLVQAPLNIFDRRMMFSGWAHRLRSRNVEFHARSIFLQGLLLMPKSLRPAAFDRWNHYWKEWDYWLAKFELTPLQACLRFVYSNTLVDRVVVGAETAAQLLEIVESLDGPPLVFPDFGPLEDSRLIDPTKWSQL